MFQVSEEMASLNGSQATTPTESNSLSHKLISGRPKRERRKRVPEKPSYPLNLWSIMKNCIGKELSKIPMPVSFLFYFHFNSSLGKIYFLDNIKFLLLLILYLDMLFFLSLRTKKENLTYL